MDYLGQAREKFKDDIYAMETTGIEIEEVRRDYAKCSMKIDRRHMNANDCVMGGAIFTLADFTFAVASNADNPLTVSLTSQINFLNAGKGAYLMAEANCIKSGRSTCMYNVSIKSDEGIEVANVNITGFRMTQS